MRLLLPEPGTLDEAGLLDLYDAAAPYVRGGMVLSADGGIAHGGRSEPLSGPADKAVFRTLRAVSDVVVVGAGTARVEGYGPVRLREPARRWRADRGRAPLPPLALVSRSLDLPAKALTAADGPLPVVVTCAAAPADRRAALAGRADVVVAGDDAVDLPDALRQLAERGLSRVLCEGGPTLLGDLARAGALTELCETVSPVLVGEGPGAVAGPLASPVPLRLAHLIEADGMLLGRWQVATA